MTTLGREGEAGSCDRWIYIVVYIYLYILAVVTAGKNYEQDDF